MKLKMIATLVLLLLVMMFAVQNAAMVEIKLLFLAVCAAALATNFHGALDWYSHRVVLQENCQASGHLRLQEEIE